MSADATRQGDATLQGDATPQAGGSGSAAGPDPAEAAELRHELRSVARDLLRDARTKAGPDETNACVEASILADSGWLGLEVPEELDGAGVTFAEVAVVLHEIGRAAASSGYINLFIRD